MEKLEFQWKCWKLNGNDGYLILNISGSSPEELLNKLT
jgi:hypothetical protein